MQPFSNNTLPLSIAQLDSTVYAEPRTTQPAPLGGQPAAAAGTDSIEEKLLATLPARCAEVESAEWALDQSLSVRDEQIAAALRAGIPAQQVAAMTGLAASELDQIVEAQAPVFSSPIAS